MAPRILETTIRDGSYEVGFHFTREDVAILGGLLDQAGFSFIEVGHGNGLGGHVFDNADAAWSDEDYLVTARRAVKRAKLGAILGFVKRTDEEILSRVQLCADVGLDFLRMGFVPSQSERPIIVESIKLAKKLGLTVSINFMRTYCAEPSEIAERSRRALDLGADWIYVVDSAGGMTFDEIRRYIEAIKGTGVAEVGFHGHNNTQKALANSLVAIDAGATLADTSLQGLGRATGNAQTEVLLTVLQEQFDAETHINRELVYDVARHYVRPLIRPGFEPTHVLSGALNVHSSSLARIAAIAAQHGVDPDTLLANAASRVESAAALEPKDLPQQLVDDALKELSSDPEGGGIIIDDIVEQAADYWTGTPNSVDEMFARLRVYARRDQRKIGVVIVPGKRWPYSGYAVLPGQGWAFGVIPVPAGENVVLGQRFSRRWVDEVFVSHGALPASPPASLAAVTVVSFDDLEAEAAVSVPPQTSCLVAVDDAKLRAAIVGRLGACERVVTISSIDDAAEPGRYDHVIVEGKLGSAVLSGPDFIAALAPEAIVTITGREPLPPSTLSALRERVGRVRIPDLVPLLVARATKNDEVALLAPQANLAQVLAQNPDAPVSFRGQVVTVESTSLGSWLPARAEAGSDDEGHEVSKAVQTARLHQIIGRRAGTAKPAKD